MSLRTMSERAIGSRVGEVLSAIEWMSAEDVLLAPVACRAREVRPGDIYVAIDSPRHDGHLEAAMAVERGAVAVVAERLLPVFGVAQFVVADSRRAFGELCQALAGHPSSDVATIGVVGTYGKSSITMLLDSIFRAAGRTSCYQTKGWTRLESVGARHLPPTTAPAIAEFLAESVAAECQHAVVELSEQALANRAAEGVELDVLCVANLPADNAPRGRSRQQVRDTIASSLELLGDRGIAIFNAGDPDAIRLMSETESPSLTFGIDCEAEIVGTLLEQHTCGQEFLLTIGDDTIVVEAKIPGRAHLENCLAAAAVARVYGISLIDIARGIAQLTVVPGVMQKLPDGAGVATYIDRGDSPVARGTTLATARDVAQGKVLAVVAHDCPVAQRLADQTVVTSGLRATPAVRQLVDQLVVAEGLDKSPKSRALIERMTGIAVALEMAREGDVVVVSGLGPVGSGGDTNPGVAREDEIVKTLLAAYAQRKVA